MEPRLEANRVNWNDRVGVHVQSQFYDVDGWLRRASGPQPREIEALGDVEGRTLLHLQCHFGMDTLAWARAGAIVTGLDFSPDAVLEATALAERAGLSERATFICSDVYDARAALAGNRFDIVYVSLGALCWLPDVAAWGAVVADLLSPGGRLYLHDVHPFSSCLDENGEKLVFGYFEEKDNPFVGDFEMTYTGGAPLTHTRTYEWNHSIGEVWSALTDQGLVIDSFVEHDWTVFHQFPWLTETAPTRFSVPAGRPRIPLAFTLLAHWPGRRTGASET